MAGETLSAAESGAVGRTLRRTRTIVIAVLGLLAVYYGAGMLWLHTIDDDPDFAVETSAPEGGSRAVAVAADLIDREINTHRWVANDPFFMPAYLLDNMPNYQQGIIAVLSRFAVELTDHIARTRGSSQADEDLESAAGLLKYPGNVWIFDLSTSLAPTASSESQYRRAMERLRAYNERLAQGRAAFETRADNLLATVDRLTADLGSASAAIDQQLRDSGSIWPDFQADDLFYFNKGRLYGAYLILRELGADYADVIRDNRLEAAWGTMVDNLRDAATLQPWVVVNGAPDGQMLPSHLASQGFFLLRARTQLKEIANILLK